MHYSTRPNKAIGKGHYDCHDCQSALPICSRSGLALQRRRPRAISVLRRLPRRNSTRSKPPSPCSIPGRRRSLPLLRPETGRPPPRRAGHRASRLVRTHTHPPAIQYRPPVSSGPRWCPCARSSGRWWNLRRFTGSRIPPRLRSRPPSRICRFSTRMIRRSRRWISFCRTTAPRTTDPTIRS